MNKTLQSIGHHFCHCPVFVLFVMLVDDSLKVLLQTTFCTHITEWLQIWNKIELQYLSRGGRGDINVTTSVSVLQCSPEAWVKCKKSKEFFFFFVYSFVMQIFKQYVATFTRIQALYEVAVSCVYIPKKACFFFKWNGNYFSWCQQKNRLSNCFFYIKSVAEKIFTLIWNTPAF